MSADTPAVDFAAILCPCSAVAPPYTGMAPGWMKGSAWDWVPCDHSQSMAHYVLSAMHDTPDHPPFDCPDCPTIGKLLAIGAAVMAATEHSAGAFAVSGEVEMTDNDTAASAVGLLRFLRSVQP